MRCSCKVLCSCLHGVPAAVIHHRLDDEAVLWFVVFLTLLYRNNWDSAPIAVS